MSASAFDPVRLAERVASWLVPAGDASDVVISSRVRLARNLDGYPFVPKLSDERARELANKLRPALESFGCAGRMQWIDIAESSDVLRLLLRERHLVSRDLAPSAEERAARIGRAVAFSDDERLSVMVNEEDHLRLQSMEAGFDLEAAFARALALDREIETRLKYATSTQHGYLTACPTNVGTGLRASVMLHLPALALVQSELEKVFTAAARTGLAVRGLYGEGSRAFGDFYQLSNQVTLGRSEESLLAELRELVPAVVAFERSMRAELVKSRRPELSDRAARALGLVRSSRAMSTETALSHLSILRLGQLLGLCSELDLRTLARLRVQIQKAHLQVQSQRAVAKEFVEPTERDRLRAEALRRAFA
ncbi:MAG: ATP--guanido phosphotransferase [Planctomycetes bacterium]|nr:ATP--guanido phosphotransferase [Planctomycetota bacterium]